MEPLDLQQSSSKLKIDASRTAVDHNRQGLDFLRRGYPLHAIDEFKIAIMLNPNSALSGAVYNNLGRAYEKIRQYDLAITAYQHAVRINPDFALYYKNMVYAYKLKNALNSAQKEYEAIVKLNPYDADAYFTLGLIHESKGNISEAKKYFSKFVELEPQRDLASAARRYISAL